MSKMSGKQAVVGGFDLAAFVGDAEDKREAPHPKPQPRQLVRQAPPREQLTERVQVKITKAEMDTLKKKAGLVPISKWLRNELKERGIV